MHQYIDMKEPGMIQFLAHKMVENDGCTLFEAMLKIMWAIWWTHEKKYCSLRLCPPSISDHEQIMARSIAVGLRPPSPSHIGAWTNMLCHTRLSPQQFSDLDWIAWIRSSMDRRTILDNG